VGRTGRVRGRGRHLSGDYLIGKREETMGRDRGK
jgi:hypothetical protein